MRMNNTLSTMLLFIIVISFIIPSYNAAYNVFSSSQTVCAIPPPDSILDQYQTQHNHLSNIHSVVWMAQSFQPSITPLTKVDLKLEKFTEINNPIELSIRKDLIDTELTYISLSSEQIPYYTNWVEFDFADIEVNVNETYFIVVRTRSPAGHSYSWYDEYSQDRKSVV